jgi:O-antigen ligase
MLSSIKTLNFCFNKIIGFIVLLSFVIPTRQASILVFITTVITIIYLFNKRELKITKSYLPIYLLFSWHLFSFIFNDNFSNDGAKKMETYLCILSWIFYSQLFNFEFLKTNFNRIFFILAILLNILFFIFISIALFNFFQTKNTDVFFYFDLLKPFALHPIYLSLLILITIIHLVLKNIVKIIKIDIIMLIILQFFLILLSSKTLIFLNALFYIYIILSRKSFKTKIISIFLIFIFLIGISLLPFVQKRFCEISKTSSLSILNQQSIDDWNKVNGLTMRLFIQKNALNYQINEGTKSIVFGMGAGNSIEILNKINEIHNMAITYFDGKKEGLYNYNLHSQYLQFIFNFGIIGLFIFIYTIFNIVKTNALHNLFLNLSIILFIFAFFTESYLETFRGIQYFMFIYVLKKQLQNDKIDIK